MAAVLTAARCCQSQDAGFVIDKIYVTIGATHVTGANVIGTLGDRSRSIDTAAGIDDDYGVHYDQVTSDRLIIPPEFSATRIEWDLCLIHLNHTLPVHPAYFGERSSSAETVPGRNA